MFSVIAIMTFTGLAGQEAPLSPAPLNDTLPASIKTDWRAERHLSGTYHVNTDNLRPVVSPVGEYDPIKYVMTLPGVSSGAEGSSAIFARGGNLGNNLITLDGVRIYGYSHLLGLASSIPSGAISSMDFCLGGFEGEQGGLTASHISLRTPDIISASGGEVSVSNSFVSAVASAPFAKEKASVLVSGRWSPFSLEYNLLKNSFDKDGRMPSLSLNVFDLFAKAAWRVSPADEVSLTGFYSGDDYSIGLPDADYMPDWKNITGHLAYRHTAGNTVIYVDASYNFFRNNMVHLANMNGKESRFQLQSRIEDQNYAVKATHSIFDGKLTLSEGIRYQRLMMSPGAARKSESAYLVSEDVPYSENVSHPSIASGFAEVKFSYESLDLMANVRLNHYKNNSVSRSNTYTSLDPEFSVRAKWLINDGFGIEATYDNRVQYDHTLEGSPLGWPLDLVVPSTKNLIPEHSIQYYGGLFTSFLGHRITAGGYWKTMENLVYYTDAAALFTSAAQGWNNFAQVGRGTSYGLELLYEGSLPQYRISWEASYTWSKSDRAFSNINSGSPFPAKFDRPHICNASVHWGDLTVSFTYQSGHNETVPAGQYAGYLPSGNRMLDYFDHPDNWRMPAYVRFDAGYSIGFHSSFKDGRQLDHHFTFGVFNLLNRHNASMLVYDQNEKSWYFVSLFPVMPNVRYSLKF